LQQDYKNVEIIISDDSPDEDIKDAITQFNEQLKIRYFHNCPPLRSPKNWNNALDKAEGDLVVLMHQDDWYHTNQALSTYVYAFQNEAVDFVFCQNTAIDEKGNKIILQAIPGLLNQLTERPDHLLLAQVIGPPSNTMLRREIETRYDERFIWLVDVDYYSRLLKEGNKYVYLPEHLVSIGLHEDQTTVFCRTNSDIIFKENIWFAKKLGVSAFYDSKIFDYYWRLLRNYHIRSTEDFGANNVEINDVPVVILHMLRLQKKVSLMLLKIGPFSKFLMFLNFSCWRMTVKKR
jgi:glycosyltransferase involved in cell wall biosynthesis